MCNGDFHLSDSEKISDRARVRRITTDAYKFPIAHYCQVFAEPETGKPLNRKTVERWIAKGKRLEAESGGLDLPPLDEPWLMADWWRRTTGRKVSEVFAAFEIRGEGGGAAEVPAEAAGGAEQAEAAAEAARVAYQAAEKDAAVSDVGFEAALGRVRLAERFAHSQWKVTQLEPDKFTVTAIDKRKKVWEDALSAMLKMEEKADKVLAGSEEWATWREVEEAIAPILADLSRGVRTLLTRVGTKINIPAELFAEMLPLFDEEVNRLFRVFEQGDFRELLELE